MGFNEKVDVLDLLIYVIREHEDRLDELISEIERVIQESYELGVVHGERLGYLEALLEKKST